MTTNFHFLENEFKAFFDRAIKAEQFLRSDPRTSLVYSRMALEESINWMYTHDDELTLPYDTSLFSLMAEQDFKEQFNHKLYSDLHIIRKAGNLATHNKPVNDIDSHHAIEALYHFAKWFARSYAKNEIEEELGSFDFNSIPNEGQSALTRSKIEELEQKLAAETAKHQTVLKEKEAERKALAEENEFIHKQYLAEQAQIESNKAEANAEDEVQHPRNEAETRKYLIDITLREAGWDLSGANDNEFKVRYMPKSTNKTETGFVDYVLWDDDGLPLAVVEAKRAITSAKSGENQAQFYADALEKMYGRRPVMYYSNGYEIYLWDDQFYKQAREVHGFYTKAELQTLMYRRKNRKDIRTAQIDLEIAGRDYQMRSIRSIAEHFAGNDKASNRLIGTYRGALLVLATGTGKTRTAIVFSKIMMECNWAKRILFLADRTSLVDQAMRNFVKFLPEHASVNLLQEKDNPDARIAFSTYQTMMGLIDGSREAEARFYGVGHFDLIIIDEAHRSIYKKYSAIFDYFDALFLGLTATPQGSIDRNTYEAFGLADQSPTDAYTFDDAVKNNHLVPYHSIEVPTKFLEEGIRYDDLTEEEKEIYEEEILDGGEASENELIPSSDINKWLFNKDTALKTLRYILEHGIKKRGGDELGKTIIFAKNQKHAHFLKEMFMELDKERFGNDYVKVITHNEPKAKEFINRFCDEEKDRLPQIVISVDMMDTGIDAPSCVNLVFYKQVRSYTKFWQMIGRGTRLRPDLFGPGEDKTHFLIFDLCGNFKFFGENPEGIEASSQKSLTEILFGLRLQLAQYLKSDQFMADQKLQDFRNELIDGLFQEVASLNKERFDVKMNLQVVHEFGEGTPELWNHLSEHDIRKIEVELAPLVKPAKGDTDLARYYDRLLYSLIGKSLEMPDKDEFFGKFTNPISKVASTSKKLLRKTTIPEVKAQEDLIKLPLDESFWKESGVEHLEKLRKSVRQLVKYIDPVDQRYVTTDFEDTILKDKIVVSNFGETYGDYVSPFQNNVHRLEKIIREHANNLTIIRIRKGEKITPHELLGLEAKLFNDGVNKEEVEKELGSQFNMVQFIVSLMGLDPEKVDAAFANFINEYQLNSVQIQFLDTIKKFLTKNGKIEPAKLYDSPFKGYHNMGIDGVFTTEQADNIFKIVGEFNQAVS